MAFESASAPQCARWVESHRPVRRVSLVGAHRARNGPGAVPLAAGAQAHGERCWVKSSVACEDSAFAVCSYFGMVAPKLREASVYQGFAWLRLSENEVT